MTTRRAVLAGAAALALLPGRGRAQRATFRAALDAVEAKLADPPAALALLDRIDPRGLTVSQQLDLITARAGLRTDLAIMAARPLTPALLLRRKVGDGIDPAVATRRLELERRHCAARADHLFAQLGVRGADTGARFAALWHDPRYQYPDSAAALADMNQWLARFRTAVPTLIGAVPPWCRNVTAAPPTPADLATGHLGYRTLPTPTTAGGYVPDFARLTDRPSFTMPSVVAHELLPGHMIQLPLEVAADPHPLRLRYTPGFGEGWGIYAECLVAEAGFYARHPEAELGYLHWRLFRICRALVDFAIHGEGLSVPDARARLVAWQGEPAYFGPFDADLARIQKEPLVRAAEMLSALSIEDGARGRTGKRRARYHHLLLANGRMRSDELARRAATLA